MDFLAEPKDGMTGQTDNSGYRLFYRKSAELYQNRPDLMVRAEYFRAYNSFSVDPRMIFYESFWERVSLETLRLCSISFSGMKDLRILPMCGRWKKVIIRRSSGISTELIKMLSLRNRTARNILNISPARNT